MRWLVLVFFSSVLAAPIQNWSCSSTFNESCFSYPQDCSSCNATLKVKANEATTVYDIFVRSRLADRAFVVLKITEFNGSKHDIFCSPLENNASIWMDKRPLTTYEGATVTFVEGTLTETSAKCSVETSVAYDERNTYHVSTGVFDSGNISIEKGMKLERAGVPHEKASTVYGMKIAGVVDVEDKSSTPKPVASNQTTSTTAAAPAETSTAAEDTTTTTSPVTVSQEDEPFEESNNSTGIAEEATGLLQDFVANDTDHSVPSEDKLSEAAVQKKQMLEAQSRSLDFEEDASVNKTVTETPVKSNTSDTQSTTEATKEQPKLQKPVDSGNSTNVPESRALDTDESSTARPVAEQKKPLSNEPEDFSREGMDLEEDDPDFSTTLSSLASITFAILTTLLL